MKSELSRNRYFLMGIAMIGIVFFHHCFQVIPVFTSVMSRFGLWGVDIFLFLSGFGCVYALQKYSLNEFWRRRLNRLLPTCLLVGVSIYLIDFIIGAEKTLAPFPLRFLSLHRWFIQAIVICYSICPLAFRIISKYRGWGLFALSLIAVIIAFFVPDIHIYRLQWCFDRLPVFFIGMYVAMYDLHLNGIEYIVSILCLLMAILIRCKGGWFVFQWEYFLAVSMPFICEILCKLRDFCVKIRVYKPLVILGIYSLQIYLIHEYTYWSLATFDIPIWSKYIFFLMVVVPLSYFAKVASNFISSHKLISL